MDPDVENRIRELHQMNTIIRDMTSYVHRPRDVMVVPRTLPIQLKTDLEKNIEGFIESCPAKSFVALVAGKFQYLLPVRKLWVEILS